MTKRQELQRLDRFIASLPTDTYLRPWLEEERAGIEADLLNDFPVAASLAAHRRYAEDEARSILDRANQSARAIVAEARQQAAELTQEAQRDRQGAEQVRDRLTEALRSASYQLQNV